ncbi:MAG: branched-chain amino acid ABC transporter substrate-binding protein [Alphaproteobacteria bacterium]|nr:branched-chain amino acid ABC transporter substrate-binding protein [Alphaproteobacteria bacterium]
MRNVATAVLAAALAGIGGVASAQDIAVATAGPMTGQYAVFGEQMRRGAELAIENINAKGGVLGRKLKLEVGDDACDPKQAVAVANQLASKKVALVAGHFCSSSSIPASAVYNENGILQISPASTNPALTDDAAKKGWKNVFRTCGRDDAQGLVAGKFLANRYKGKKVAIIHDKSAYGKGLADETKKAMNAAGLKEAMYEAISQGDKDFTALITKMKSQKIEAMYLGGYHTEGGLLVRQAKEQGLNALLVSGDALVTEEFWKITGKSGEGTLMTFAPDPRKEAAAKDVVAQFKTKGFDPEGYTLYTYAAIQVWADAAAKAKSLKTADVAKVLRGAKHKSVIGTLDFNAKGDVVNPIYVFYSWKDGKYTEIGSGA